MKRLVYLLMLAGTLGLAKPLPSTVQAFIDQAKEKVQASAVVVVYDMNRTRFINDADLARMLRFEPENMLYPLWLCIVKSPDLIDDLTPFEVFETLKHFRIPYRDETDQAALAYIHGKRLSLRLLSLVRLYGELPYRGLYASKELDVLQTEMDAKRRIKWLRYVLEYRRKSGRLRHTIEMLKHKRERLLYATLHYKQIEEIDALIRRYRSRLPRSSLTVAKQDDIVVGVIVLHATFPVAGYRHVSDYVAQTLLEMLGASSQKIPDDPTRSIAPALQ